jgi:hypothetical protein
MLVAVIYILAFLILVGLAFLGSVKNSRYPRSDPPDFLYRACRRSRDRARYLDG